MSCEWVFIPTREQRKSANFHENVTWGIFWQDSREGGDIPEGLCGFCETPKFMTTIYALGNLCKIKATTFKTLLQVSIWWQYWSWYCNFDLKSARLWFWSFPFPEGSDFGRSISGNCTHELSSATPLLLADHALNWRTTNASANALCSVNFLQN